MDPTAEVKGPGLGHGVKKAAAGVAQHVDLAAKSASTNVKTQSLYVSSYAKNVTKWADEVADLVQQIKQTTTAASAAGLVTELQTLTNQLTGGIEAVGRFDAQGACCKHSSAWTQMKKGEGL